MKSILFVMMFGLVGVGSFADSAEKVSRVVAQANPRVGSPQDGAVRARAIRTEYEYLKANAPDAFLSIATYLGSAPGLLTKEESMQYVADQMSAGGQHFMNDDVVLQMRVEAAFGRYLMSKGEK